MVIKIFGFYIVVMLIIIVGR